MLKRLLLAATLLASPALGQDQRNTIYIAPLGYCQLAAISTATAVSTCTGGIPAGTAWAAIIPETNGIRWRDDGTNPTASVGMPVSALATMYYNSKFSALVIIPQTGSATINISFYSGAGQQ